MNTYINVCYMDIYLCYLLQQPTLSEMTANEVEFSLRVEEMLSSIQRPEFRQSIVEVNCATHSEAHSNLHCFDFKITVGLLINLWNRPRVMTTPFTLIVLYPISPNIRRWWASWHGEVFALPSSVHVLPRILTNLCDFCAWIFRELVTFLRMNESLVDGVLGLLIKESIGKSITTELPCHF